MIVKYSSKISVAKVFYIKCARVSVYENKVYVLDSLGNPHEIYLKDCHYIYIGEELVHDS